jgi:hypothetical protein
VTGLRAQNQYRLRYTPELVKQALGGNRPVADGYNTKEAFTVTTAGMLQ